MKIQSNNKIYKIIRFNNKKINHNKNNSNNIKKWKLNKIIRIVYQNAHFVIVYLMSTILDNHLLVNIILQELVV